MTLRARFAVAAVLLLAGAWTSSAAAWSPVRGPDFSGVWTNDATPWPALPYTPEYQAIYDKRRAGEAAGVVFPSPPTRCLPPGLPWIMTGGAYPMEIYQWDSQVTMVRENLGSMRRIQLKRGHDPDSGFTYNGDSVGHWEGAVLVVDTVGVSADAPIFALLPHSDAFHVVERIRLLDRDTLTDEITIDDAKALTRPTTITVKYRKDPTIELREYVCESNRNGYDASGKPFILPPGSP